MQSLLLLPLLLACGAAGFEVADFYFEYPEHVVPNVENLRRFSGDRVFELTGFAPEVYVPDYEMLGPEQVLARYRFVEEFQGFVFAPTGTLVWALMRTNSSARTFSGYVGEMAVSEEGYTYYEKLPGARSDWIVSRLYGAATRYSDPVRVRAAVAGATAEQTGAGTDRFVPAKHCLIRGPAATLSLCNEIPKCFGVQVRVEEGSGQGEPLTGDQACLLGYIARELLTGATDSAGTVALRHKLGSKAVLRLLERNRRLVVAALLIFWDAQIVFYNWSNPLRRNRRLPSLIT